MNEDKGASRPSVGAANALLSRVYLYMSGTYENPNTQYAQKAIGICLEGYRLGRLSAP